MITESELCAEAAPDLIRGLHQREVPGQARDTIEKEWK